MCAYHKGADYPAIMSWQKVITMLNIDLVELYGAPLDSRGEQGYLFRAISDNCQARIMTVACPSDSHVRTCCATSVV